MSNVNTLIDPRKVADLEAILVGLDPKIAARFRTREMQRLQDEANSAAVNRRLYANAFEQAQLNGHPDPQGFALDQVQLQGVIKLHERRTAAIFKRINHQNRMRANKLAAKVEASSKTAKKGVRRFPQADRHYVDIVGKAERLGHLDNAPLVLSTFPSYLRTYKLPHWDKATISLKVMAMSLEAAKEGAQTINLRVSPSVRASALASPRGPASYMQDAIRRAFRSVFGSDGCPEFWFVIELDGSSADAFHLHGAVATPSVANGRELVDAALRSAAGGWGVPGGAYHQQVSRELLDPIYWASYAVKTMNISGREIERKLLASTNGIRAWARGSWEDVRASLPQPGM
ncbi:hypothetical protein G5B46_20120 [Caulobacter sp. 602-2]|uniref:Uncharacterized protein n=1 Tax=Caulobacter sp. 602-2 TaxID=2710887 RepID=A0A6G4R2Y0_9CAUL|nr:hypothetical protein [Caulobacter sp. 602-2]NGM51924.1 hypothetical protein [Caulobacter sp. 602-2]